VGNLEEINGRGITFVLGKVQSLANPRLIGQKQKGGLRNVKGF